MPVRQWTLDLVAVARRRVLPHEFDLPSQIAPARDRLSPMLMGLQRMRFGERLKSLLEERGMSIGDLARYTEYDRTWLWSLTAGKSSPSFEALVKIGEALEVDAADLLITPTATVRHAIMEYSRHVPVSFNAQVRGQYEREIASKKKKAAAGRR